MLKVPAPFPQVGSFALLVDETQPPGHQRAELVRILRRYRQDREAPVAVAFPLRSGASGNQTTTVDKLIDGTPLTRDEARELTDLQRVLGGQVRPNRAKVEKCESLRKRLVFSQILTAELAKLDRLNSKAQPSTGARFDRSAA